MSWAVLVLMLGALGAALALRRRDLAGTSRALAERGVARARGSHKARLQHPHVDLTRCIGCGLCVEACPEDGVLELVHGQAMVVHGARCVGHGRCAAECPVGAIALTLGDVRERRDLPALSESLESLTAPGVFLAGEVTGYALVRTAIGHGTAVADEVARRTPQRCNGEAPLDLCIVGAGPAGLACALQAKRRGLRFVAIDQEGLGGTVARYPRRKLVMTQPVELPLHGRLARTSYSKEELIELWEAVVRSHELPIRTAETFQGLERAGELLRVRTDKGVVEARNVCLALGRRGSPRKLGVSGEELPKVAYALLDAQSYQHRRILVVGGGDSAIEAALGLSEQPGNRVALSYRKAAFFRLKARNELALQQALAAGRLEVLYESDVEAILPDAVVLRVRGGAERATLPNDEVFVLAGGVPPFELLEKSGVSFDPALRPAQAPLAEQGSGLRRALLAAFALTAAALAWALGFRAYYGLPREERFLSPLHDLLRPAGGAGLALGVAASAMVAVNLSYLLRRSPRAPLRLGSLRAWMSVHVASGLFALVLALLHSGMAPAHSVGGHAFAALAVLVATGAVGRYLYAFVPRAANGRELALEEARARLEGLAQEWDRLGPGLGARMREQVEGLVAPGRWGRSLPRRLAALVRSQVALERALGRLRAQARAEGLADDQLQALGSLARRAHRAALEAAHFEDLRALLASWRWIHRWTALLMVLLVARHVAVALRYASFGAGS